MKHLKAPKADRAVLDDHARLLQNLNDYTSTILLLFWQRQAIFLSATVLTGYYFDPQNAALFYVIILFTELQDFRHAGRVAALHSSQQKAISRVFRAILLNTTLSAALICIYAVSVAFSQEAGGHFTPLFFLFAAALFAAMNNHQLVPALVIRLTLYGISFAVITIRDLWIEGPPIQSELWLHFFTVVFVMYFLIDCSVVFFKLYRKNLEAMETLKQEHAHTTAAYLVKSQFVSTVSHELRTPLTSIKLSLDLINSGALGPVPSNIKGIVETAGRNGERLSKLIDDVLDLQKLEAGEMRYQMEVLDTKSFLHEAIDANARFAEAKDVKLVADYPDDPPLYIEADEMRLMQVMSNMISNAVKFSHKGGTVSIGCLDWKGKTTIYVKDTGIGIPEGSREKVFGKFTQVDSSDRRQVGGTGLGMSISKEIIEHFKGKMDYLSVPGEGTTFFVELPTHGRAAQQLKKA